MIHHRLSGGLSLRLSKHEALFRLLVAGALILQAWSLRVWVVDDAAISMSYARSLWYGWGLVPQFGAPRVEGFSNPLWVLLLSPFSGFQSAFLIAKSLSLLLTNVAACRLASVVETATNTRWAGWFAALLLAMQPSVTIWAQSGLENAFTLMLGVELLFCLVQAHRMQTGTGVRAGVIAGLLAVTRPEGIAYAWLYPVTCLLAASPRSWRVSREAGQCLSISVAIWIGYGVFRWFYFGAWLPNTYLAKGGVTTARVRGLLLFDPYVLQTWRTLFASLWGRFDGWWIPLTVALITVGAWRRIGRGQLLPAGLLVIVVLGLQVLLPADWMDEHRLATLFYPAIYALFAVGLASWPRRSLAIGLAAISVCLAAWQGVERYASFVAHPNISVSEVTERSQTFERWASHLGLRRASILTADVGGILLRDRLIAVDLGMLVNRPIALALGEYRQDPDRNAFRQYVFDEVRPDFISTRAYHAWLADLDADSRFRRDYVPIREYVDSWVMERYDRRVFSGDYVRRLLVADRLDALQAMRREAEYFHYPFCTDCAVP